MKEVLLVTDDKQPKVPRTETRTERYTCCRIGRCAGERSAFCAEPGMVEVDGLLLCEGHALEARFEGQIDCWEEMLFHVDVWSREASRRGRQDVMRLLEAHRAEVNSAIGRARSDLDRARRATSWGLPEGGRSAAPPPPRRGSLLAPQGGVPRLFRGLRRR